MRTAARTLCEDCLKLDLAEPELRAAFNPNRLNSGEISWRQFGEQIAAIAFTWTGSNATLILCWRSCGEARRQVINLVATEPHFGGRRWWFRCPVTGNRARVLYLPAGAPRWASRDACRLGYASQRMSAGQRQFTRALAQRPDRRNANRRLSRRRRPSDKRASATSVQSD